MPESDVFGPLVGGDDVEAAVEATLRAWLPSYLAQVSVRDGRDEDALPMPRQWVVDDETETIQPEQLPCLVISCPGLEDRPVKGGKRRYRGGWAVIVGVIVSAVDQASTHKLARLYAKAVRAVLVQKGDLDGFADSTDWLDEEYDYAPLEDGRTLAAARVTFSVEVLDIADGFAGPTTPPADPYGEVDEPPTVETSTATVGMKE